jgi:hypothetical protein
LVLFREYSPDVFSTLHEAEGERSNSNRTYIWRSIPHALVRHFSHTAGGGVAQITAQAKRDTAIKVATALSQPGINMDGWNQTAKTFQYSDHKNTVMNVFTRDLKAGEKPVASQGNWSGGVVLVLIRY